MKHILLIPSGTKNNELNFDYEVVEVAGLEKPEFLISPGEAKTTWPDVAQSLIDNGRWVVSILVVLVIIVLKH